MQKAEHSVPSERLAGSMPLRGLRKPPAEPGALTMRPGAQGKMSVSPHSAAFFKEGRGGAVLRQRPLFGAPSQEAAGFA